MKSLDIFKQTPQNNERSEYILREVVRFERGVGLARRDALGEWEFPEEESDDLTPSVERGYVSIF